MTHSSMTFFFSFTTPGYFLQIQYVNIYFVIHDTDFTVLLSQNCKAMSLGQSCNVSVVIWQLVINLVISRQQLNQLQIFECQKL